MTQLSKNRFELTVGELSERSGVPASALRFYERQGLIRSRRTSGNQRRFARDTLRRVAFVRVSQRVGIPLATIRDVLGLLPEERTPDREDWARVSQCWQEDLNSRIRQLEKLRDHLTDCVGCGCLSIDRCALANPYDRLGAEGNGPRRLLTEESPDEQTHTPAADSPARPRRAASTQATRAQAARAQATSAQAATSRGSDEACGPDGACGPHEACESDGACGPDEACGPDGACGPTDCACLTCQDAG